MTQATNAVTAICGYDAETITVRGHDLVTGLMGKLSFSQMMLLHYTGSLPGAAQTAILDAVMVTIMEHGMVPSAAVTRLTHYGAPESYQGAIAAGLLGVGDRFAGTASACAELLDQLAALPEAERADAACELVRSLRTLKKPVPGFGHPIHTGGDPRVARLMDIVSAAGAAGAHLHALGALEQAVESVVRKPLVTNVSAAIAVALGEAGVPAGVMRGVVLTARCAGLSGHLLEEQERPLAPLLTSVIEQAVRYGEAGAE